MVRYSLAVSTSLKVGLLLLKIGSGKLHCVICNFFLAFLQALFFKFKEFKHKSVLSKPIYSQNEAVHSTIKSSLSFFSMFPQFL